MQRALKQDTRKGPAKRSANAHAVTVKTHAISRWVRPPVLTRDGEVRRAQPLSGDLVAGGSPLPRIGSGGGPLANGLDCLIQRARNSTQNDYLYANCSPIFLPTLLFTPWEARSIKADSGMPMAKLESHGNKAAKPDIGC